jgi:hypothetical protein
MEDRTAEGQGVTVLQESLLRHIAEKHKDSRPRLFSDVVLPIRGPAK